MAVNNDHHSQVQSNFTLSSVGRALEGAVKQVTKPADVKIQSIVSQIRNSDAGLFVAEVASKISAHVTAALGKLQLFAESITHAALSALGLKGKTVEDGEKTLRKLPGALQGMDRKYKELEAMGRDIQRRKSESAESPKLLNLQRQYREMENDLSGEKEIMAQWGDNIQHSLNDLKTLREELSQANTSLRLSSRETALRQADVDTLTKQLNQAKVEHGKSPSQKTNLAKDQIQTKLDAAERLLYRAQNDQHVSQSQVNSCLKRKADALETLDYHTRCLENRMTRFGVQVTLPATSADVLRGAASDIKAAIQTTGGIAEGIARHVAGTAKTIAGAVEKEAGKTVDLAKDAAHAMAQLPDQAAEMPGKISYFKQKMVLKSAGQNYIDAGQKVQKWAKKINIDSEKNPEVADNLKKLIEGDMVGIDKNKWKDAGIAQKEIDKLMELLQDVSDKERIYKAERSNLRKLQPPPEPLSQIDSL